MREMKKIIYCLSVVAVLMIVASATAIPPRHGTGGETLCARREARGASRDINIHYEAGVIPSQNPGASAGDSEDDLRTPRENESDLDRVMHKDASTALRSELRATWKTYVTEHCRSITEGGKNSIHSSANLFKDWRDALRSVSYA